MRIYYCKNCGLEVMCGDFEELTGEICDACGIGAYAFSRSTAPAAAGGANTAPSGSVGTGGMNTAASGSTAAGGMNTASSGSSGAFTSTSFNQSERAEPPKNTTTDSFATGGAVRQNTPETVELTVSAADARRRFTDLFLKGNLQDVWQKFEEYAKYFLALGIAEDDVLPDRLYDLFYNKIGLSFGRTVAVHKSDGSFEILASDPDDFLDKVISGAVRPEQLENMRRENAVKAVLGCADSPDDDVTVLSRALLEKRGICVWFDSEQWHKYDFGPADRFVENLCAPLAVKALEEKLRFIEAHSKYFGLEGADGYYGGDPVRDARALDTLAVIIGNRYDSNGMRAYCRLIDAYRRRRGRLPVVGHINVSASREENLNRIEFLRARGRLSSAENAELVWLEFLGGAGFIDGYAAEETTRESKKDTFDYQNRAYTPQRLVNELLLRRSPSGAEQIAGSLMTSAEFLEWMESKGVDFSALKESSDSTISSIYKNIDKALAGYK